MIKPLILFLFTAGLGFSQIPSTIRYTLDNSETKWVVNGEITLNYDSQMNHFGKPLDFVIDRLKTEHPRLRKYVDNVLRETVELTTLSKTDQDNIYLAHPTSIGNYSLITIIPSQKTVVHSYQYLLSSENTIVIIQGFGVYK